MLKRATASLKKVAGLVDLCDVFVFGGLAMVGAGIAQIYAPAALIVTGVAVFWLGIRK